MWIKGLTTFNVLCTDITFQIYHVTNYGLVSEAETLLTTTNTDTFYLPATDTDLTKRKIHISTTSNTDYG